MSTILFIFYSLPGASGKHQKHKESYQNGQIYGYDVARNQYPFATANKFRAEFSTAERKLLDESSSLRCYGLAKTHSIANSISPPADLKKRMKALHQCQCIILRNMFFLEELKKNSKYLQYQNENEVVPVLYPLSQKLYKELKHYDRRMILADFDISPAQDARIVDDEDEFRKEAHGLQSKH